MHQEVQGAVYMMGLTQGVQTHGLQGSSVIGALYKHDKEFWRVPPLQTAFAILVPQTGRKIFVNSVEQSKPDPSMSFLGSLKLPLSPAIML